MQTIKKVPIIPLFCEKIPPVEFFSDGEVYICEKDNTSHHLCLCGCGSLVILPLDEKWWTVHKSKKGISFTPSIGNFHYPCKSHYIITDNIANFV